MNTDSMQVAMPAVPSSNGDRASLLGSPAGDFLLRITAGPQAGRLVRLSAGKCTVGSAPYCTLRLHGPEVNPVHCVILHGRGRSIVRRWSGTTLLNDRTFDDMPLAAGDRLAVGPVEFQVVQLPGQLREAVGTARRFGKELQGDRSRLDELAGRLNLANRQGRRRLRAAVAKLRKYQMRLAEMEGRRRLVAEEQTQIQLERARLEALDRDVQARLVECERRRETLASEEQLLREQAERMRTLAKQSSQDREAAQDALAARRIELSTAEARLQETIAAAQAEDERIRSETERLHKLEDELARRAADLDARAQSYAEQTARDAARLCDLDAREAQLNRALTELQRSREELAVRAAELGAQAAELKVREAGIARSSAQQTTSWTEREQALAADQTQLNARLEALSEREAAWAGREETLTRHEQVLVRREAELVARLTECREREADLAARADQLVVREAALLNIGGPSNRSESLPISTPEDGASADDAESSTAQAELERQATIAAAREAEIQAKLAAAADEATVAAARARELSDREEALQQRSAELDRQAARLAEDAAALETRVAASTESVAETTARRAELAARREEIESRAAEVADRCEALKRHWHELTAREQSLQRRIDEFEAREALPPAVDDVAEPVMRHEEVVADREMIEHAVESETNDIANSLGADSSAVEEANQTDLADEAETYEPQNEPVAEAEPESEPEHRPSSSGESAADVLRRLGMSAALEDDGEEKSASSEAQRPSPPPAPPKPLPAAPVTAAAEGGEEESLNDYMAQLFQRLGVKQGDAPAAPERKHESATPTASERAVQQPVATKQEPKPQQAPLLASEFKARSVAAERKSDLSALRELANVNARAAVANHQIKTTEKASRWKGVMAMTSGALSIAGCVVTFLGYADALPVTVTGLVGTFIFGVKSIGLRRKATKSTRSLDDVLQRSAAKMRGEQAEAKSE